MLNGHVVDVVLQQKCILKEEQHEQITHKKMQGEVILGLVHVINMF